MRGVQLYKTTEALQHEVDMYFANEETPTISGLAIFLGMTSKTFIEYGEKSEFAPTIEMARQRVEEFIERGALNNKLNATFSIFALKNRFGWKDRHEVETKLSGTLSLSALLAAADEVALPMGADKTNAIEAQTA